MPATSSAPAFDYVMSMVSVVLSLGLTHLVAGSVHLFQPPGRARFSALHAGWSMIVFAMILDLWLSLWSMRHEVDWMLGDLIVILIGVILLYVVVVLITPPREGAIDLLEFHSKNRRRYLTVGAIYYAWGSWVNVTLLPDQFDAADLYSTVPMGICMLAGGHLSGKWAQRAALVGAVLSTAVYFAIYFNDINSA